MRCISSISVIFAVFYVYGTYGYNYNINAQTTKRVCVVGAGIAGLTSARYLKEEGINFTVFEATQYVGGTWRYDPRVGLNEFGLSIHASMYKYLRTNLPKPVMQLNGFPLPKEMPSFPSGESYYQYIRSYAKHFDVEKYIKFLHLVVSIKRENHVWKVKHKHLPTGEEFEAEFDYVIVGSGHLSKPNMPVIPRENLFKGTIIHGHDYRDKFLYKDRRVLIVGAGPSGMEIGLGVAEVSKTLVHSHHSRVEFHTPWPSNYIRKPDIKEYNETGAIFVDGTYEELDNVIYCTGFEYHYPFLDASSGLNLSTSNVVPLYKYMVNIRQPTMMLIGLKTRACLVIAIDAESRYATALIKGNFTLPSQEIMLEEWQKRADAIRAMRRPLSDMRFLAQYEDRYYASLTEESGIARVPPVMFKIRMLDIQAKVENLLTYRNYKYTIIDDDTFTRELEADNTSCAP